MAARYQEGATVYELATEYGCNRTTVAARLKKTRIATCCQSPTFEAIDSMARLYASGLSLLEVGKQLGFCANTVPELPTGTPDRGPQRRLALGGASDRTGSVVQISTWPSSDEFAIEETTSHTGKILGVPGAGVRPIAGYLVAAN